MPIDNCYNDIRALLSSAEANLTTNLLAARRLQRISATATELLSGHYGKLAPFYEPLTPNFLAAVSAVNNAIVNDTATADTFNDYVGLLVVELLT